MKTLLLMFCLSLFATNFASAKEGKMTMTKDQRAKMADMYDKLSACLRSDAAQEDCMTQMHAAMKACDEACGGKCPMMKHHHEKHEHEEKSEKAEAKDTK